MILYFSGTGNSRYVAQVIKKVTQDTIISVNELLKKGIKGPLSSEKPYVFVCPTYAWRIPRILEEFIKQTTFGGNKKVYFVLTCGSETHNAQKYVKELCNKKGFELMGFYSVIMPENYIAMFDVPDKKEADLIIEKALPHILTLSEKIRLNESLPAENIPYKSKLMSGISNGPFYKFFVNAKGFYATEACINCGKCEKLCSLNNITMYNQRPQWDDHCTHCMACICGCPKEAIEYNNKSKGKPRYYNTGYKG